MGRLFVALLLVAAFCLGVAVSYYNWTVVTFNYLAGEAEVPLIALLVGAFVLGAVVMWLLGAVRLFLLRRDGKRQQKQIRDLETELRTLRNLPLDPPASAPPAPPTKNA